MNERKERKERMENPDSRYNLFRHHMVNELGISREDIKQWTEDAARVEVKKLMG